MDNGVNNMPQENKAPKMNFQCEEDKIAFFKRKQYYKSLDNFSIGSTFEEAAETMRCIMRDKEKSDGRE